MTYTASGPGGEILLPAPSAVRFDRDEDAPADGFAGTFPLRPDCGRLTGLSIRDKTGAPVFDGIVDEQERILGAAASVTLSARSRAALLLDNEALPQNYVNPSLATVFERHVRPYGFSGCAGAGRVFLGTLSVTKGMSEWAAAAAFCNLFLKTTPRVRDGIFDASGSVPDGELLFGPGGIRFASLTVRDRYCELFSELYRLGEDGGSYAPAAEDEEARALGVRRRRYLSNSGTDAEAVLSAARRKAFEAVLDCPGEIRAEPLLSVRLAGGPAGADGEWRVSSVRYRLDAGGEHTEITLRRK